MAKQVLSIRVKNAIFRELCVTTLNRVADKKMLSVDCAILSPLVISMLEELEFMNFYIKHGLTIPETWLISLSRKLEFDYNVFKIVNCPE